MLTLRMLEWFCRSLHWEAVIDGDNKIATLFTENGNYVGVLSLGH